VGIGIVCFGVWMLLAPPPTESAPLAAVRDPLQVPQPWAALWLLFRVAGSTITVPIAEELFFRGWALSAFVGSRPTMRRAAIAVVAQAAAFAAFHLLPERMPQTFLMGLVLGGLVLATGSILPAIVAHAVHNATPVLLVAAASPEELDSVSRSTLGLPPWSVGLALGCLAGGAALLALARYRRPPEPDGT
jgi:membrane protease YdiL (CAAX protease family)